MKGKKTKTKLQAKPYDDPDFVLPEDIEVPKKEEKVETRGRPISKYNPEFHPMLIQSLLENGLSMKNIAKKLKVSKETIVYWKKNFPEISQAIKAGRKTLDQRIEHSLAKSAEGYTYEEVVKEPKKLTNEEIAKRIELAKQGKKIPDVPLVVTKVTKKFASPNVLAQIFYLKNRKPDEWNDRTKIDITGKIEYKVTLPPKPPEIKQAGSTSVISAPKTYIEPAPKNSLEELEQLEENTRDRIDSSEEL